MVNGVFYSSVFLIYLLLYFFLFFCFVFFFKQKTAYEMRISDWSSDVCSSDLHVCHRSRLDFEFASTGFSVSVFRDFAQLIKTVDIVHYHFPWPMMDLAHFANRVKKPTILTYHSDVVKQKQLLKLYQPLQRRFLASVDRIVAESPNYAASSPVLARFDHKVSIIPIGQAASLQAQIGRAPV